MEIGQRTRINSLITEYPFLKQFLMDYNPNFKVLDNPILRKTIGRVATLSKAAVMGGTDVARLIEDIAAEIERQTGAGIPTAIDKPAGAVESGERTEILKGIIKDLHKGQDVDVLKRRFRELIQDIGPSEIGDLEQKLIDEGMPAEEVKRLCSTHVEIFKESLEHKTVPGLPAGHPVRTFMLENREAESIMAAIERIAGAKKESGEFPALFERLLDIETHYVRKENQLFPVLERNGVSGPSTVMWARHDDIRGMLKDVKGNIASSAVADSEVDAALKELKEMIYLEEHILYPMALETLEEQDWAGVKNGEKEAGYSWLEQVEDWEPASGTYQQAGLRQGPLNSLPKKKL